MFMPNLCRIYAEISREKPLFQVTLYDGNMEVNGLNVKGKVMFCDNE
jgi:hypothetical protein